MGQSHPEAGMERNASSWDVLSLLPPGGSRTFSQIELAAFLCQALCSALTYMIPCHFQDNPMVGSVLTSVSQLENGSNGFGSL